MEVHAKTNAMVAALRCWEAMKVAEDGETRRSLWRAAVKYAHRAREDARLMALADALTEDAQGVVLGLGNLRAF